MTSALVRRGMRAASSSLALLLVLGPGTLAAQAQTSENYRDEFRAISYSGSDGSLSWSGQWEEIGEADGPTGGFVEVVTSNRCAAGNCLRIRGGQATNHGVLRELNLTDADTATLRFAYRRHTESSSPGSVLVQVSTNGGSSWSTAGSIPFGGPKQPASATLDISGAAGQFAFLRFLGVGDGVNGRLYFDNIDIELSTLPPITTTTTTQPITTTTTTQPITTTTTTQPITTTTQGTTTTTTRATTTTTTQGTTTTTTQGTTTTTTRATTTTQGTTTTTVDGGASAPGSSSTTTTDAAATTTTIVAGGAEGGSSSPPTQRLPGPIGGLQITFSTASEAIGDNMLSVIALAALTGALAIAGLERRRRGGAQTETPLTGWTDDNTE